MMRGWVFVLCLCATTAGWAWPVDVYVDLQAGKEEFRRLTAVSWVDVEDPSIADAEVLPSGELLLTGRAPGRTLVLLYAEGKFAVWRVRVAAAPRDGEAELALVTKACRKLQVEKAQLAAVVANDACRKALVALFQTDRFSARDVELTFELPALQAQLAEIQKALREKDLKAAQVSYRGAGVVLEGRLSPEEHRRALWALFRRSAGRVPLEDRSEVAGALDAGTPE